MLNGVNSAHWINPSWVALDASRGIETAESKLFMRTSVIALDALTYIPALIMFANIWQGTRSKRTQASLSRRVQIRKADLG